ncbi:MAG: hypothetical protein ACOX71_08235 [Lachnospiraceae bacterium]|jgi:hypothetical protein
MSQVKVDNNKMNKKNRAKINKKEKVLKIVEIAAGAVAVAAIAFWIGYSVYNSATRTESETAERQTKVIDITDYETYESGLALTYRAADEQ